MNNKISIVVLTFAILFLAPQISFATSGACSSHGGVNCSIGPNWQGHVTCNDGWNESTVAYASMVECMNPLACQMPTWTPSCYPNVKGNTTYLDVQNKIQASVAASGGIVNDHQFQAEVNSCWSFVSTYLAQLSTYTSCSVNVSPSIPATSPTPIICPAHSNNINGNCTCNYGYSYANGSCQITAASCAATLGTYSHVMQVTEGTTITPKCVCNDGYIAGTDRICTDNRVIKTISQKAYDRAVTNQNCKSDPALSEAELNQCASYEANSGYFNWQIIPNPQTPSAVAPVIVSNPNVTTSQNTKLSSDTGTTKNPKVTIRQATQAETSPIILVTATSTINSIPALPTLPAVIPVKKHSWYHWINPLNWFGFTF